MTAKDVKCDAELYQAAVQGGPKAFGLIVKRYQDAVFGVALARLRDFHEAEDMAQHVFVEAFQRLGNLKDPSRLGAWLRSITIHRCIDRLRRKHETADVETCEMRASDRAQPSAELERRELREQVLAAIGRLSRTQCETTMLFYVNGYSIAEVASVQGVPVGTVKRRLHDARERLKEELVGMVENVLKSEAPKDDFARKVFEILNKYPGQPHPYSHLNWDEIIAELRKIGGDGFEGFIRALESPHSPTRAFAAQMLSAIKAPQRDNVIADLLMKALSDANRKVRRHAIEALLRGGFDEEMKRRQFVPLIVPMLADPSKWVRRVAACGLVDWAMDVPVEAAVKALLAETDPELRKGLKTLLHTIVYGEKKFYTE